MIEIVEEISAVIKFENLQETTKIARELRESIVATEPVVEIKTGNLVHKINSEQLDLSHKLQNAISALFVEVCDSAQELAPGIEEEVLQRVAKVTAHLQADLVAVTGVNVAVQAPITFVVEEEEPFDTLHKPAQIQKVPSISTDAVVETSETVVLENVETVDNIVAPVEHANAEQLQNEKVAPESIISHLQETTEVLDQVLTQEIDSLPVTHEIDVEKSMSPVTEQMKLIENKVISTEAAIKASDALIAASTDEVVVESESDKVRLAEPESVTIEQLKIKEEFEESINKNGKFTLLCSLFCGFAESYEIYLYLGRLNIP